MKRITIPSVAALLVSMLLTAPVAAAAPGNDAYAGRTVIPDLPYSDTLDTRDATTDAVDAELLAQCEPPAMDASVWYELTAASDEVLLIETSASSYSAGIIVVTGTPGAFGPIEACGPGSVAFPAVAGTTYAILVFDDQIDGGGNGGILELAVSVAPPSPSVDVTVDPVAHFDARSGSLTLTGTITCDAGAFAFIDASVRQSVGRFTISGFGFAEIECDGGAQSWSLEALGDTGQFKGGQAVVSPSWPRPAASTAASMRSRRRSAFDADHLHAPRAAAASERPPPSACFNARMRRGRLVERMGAGG